MTLRFAAWSAWTPDAGPPTDALGFGPGTRCLRAAAHVLAPLRVPSWADRAVVVASVTGDPDAPPGSDPLAHLPLRLGELLHPRSITAICAGANTVAMSLFDTFCRLQRCDRVVLLVIEPAPAAELAVAFSIENSEGEGAFRLDPSPAQRHETPSGRRSGNPCRDALHLARALDQRGAVVPVGDRWALTFSWRDSASNPQ
jgi:hypothetical protein